MEQKTKFILIGLAGAALIFFFLFIQTLGTKQRIQRERDVLQKENTALNSKVSKLETGLRDFENKIGLLNREKDRISQEKQELEKKYELVNKAREELIEKLKSKKTEAVPQVPQAQALSQATESYWAGILRIKSDLETQVENLRTELKTTQINNEQLQRDNDALSSEIKGLEREKQDLTRQVDFIQKQLDYNKQTMDSLSLQLVGERNDKLQIEATLKAVKSENNIFRRQLRNLSSRKIALERKLVDMQGKNAEFEKRFKEMDILLKDKILQLDTMNKKITTSGGVKESTGATEEEAVELPEIVVRPREETVAPTEEDSRYTGKVLTVNKENNFVIIDLGESAGIKAGDIFQIVRGGENIATIEVIKTSKSAAACDIKRQSSSIKIGDTVR